MDSITIKTFSTKPSSSINTTLIKYREIFRNHEDNFTPT